VKVKFDLRREDQANISDTNVQLLYSSFQTVRHHDISSKMNNIVRSKSVVKTTPLIARVLGKSNALDHIEAIKYGRTKESIARIFCV